MQPMTPLTFTATVLGLYGAYYGTLLLIDRLSRRRSQPSPETLYTLPGDSGGQGSPSPTLSAKEGLLPERYLPPPGPDGDPGDEDSDLGIEYLSDDGIEATDENLATLLRQPNHP